MIDQYRGIAPESVLRELDILAQALQGYTLKHVNSTRRGGGVAEILNRLNLWIGSLGIRTGWEVITGSSQFFQVTKAMHNALQGADIEVPHTDLQFYLECLQENAQRLDLEADVVVVHDPQPAYLIDFSAAANRRRWVWRCHIDLSHPSTPLWRFLAQAVSKYAMVVFHVPHFAQPELPVPQVLISPSIDPLTDKNRELREDEITAVTDRFGIDRRRPILLQVSRFDRFKDPLGVIASYRQVRRHFDCQLVLAGGDAIDDPEGPRVRAEVYEAAYRDQDILILSGPTDLEVNALQRAATVIIQKSTREGFGLTVTEGMWKGKPVIGGAAGGIPAQIIHGVTGFMVSSPDGLAFRLRYLLSHPGAAREMGEKGREHVRRNFLITKHVRDYLLLMLMLLQQKEGPILLTRPRE